VEPVFVGDLSEVPELLREQLRDDDVVLTMGAGSVGQLPSRLVALGEGA
jgi:UDP-N-acetylmuramate--alanine ligase